MTVQTVQLTGQTDHLEGQTEHMESQTEQRSVLAQLLSSQVRAEILRLLFNLRAAELHGRDIQRRSGLAVGTVQQELKRLVGLGLAIARRAGNRVYFRANAEHPLYGELRSLVTKTVGLVDVLREALTGDGIQLAFVYGSVASGREGTHSDVDLLVVGEVGLRALSTRLRGVAGTIGREVNPTILEAAEFRARVARGEPFLARVLSEPALFVVGTRDELVELAG
jgi:uncharacterized protein